MPIKLVPAGDMESWTEPVDTIRVEFDSTGLLQRAGMSVREAHENRERFVAVLADLLDDHAHSELRSPGPQYGPHAGGGIESFLDVVITTSGILGAVDVACRIAQRLNQLGIGARVSSRAIEMLSRQQLRLHGQRESSTLVSINLIPMESQLTGPPPGFAGFAAVFRLDDGRLVTMRWSLDGVLKEYTEGAPRPSPARSSDPKPAAPADAEPPTSQEGGVRSEYAIRTARALRVRVHAVSAEETLTLGGDYLEAGDEGIVIPADDLPVGS